MYVFFGENSWGAAVEKQENFKGIQNPENAECKARTSKSVSVIIYLNE